MSEIDSSEPILNPAKERFTVFPIEYNDIWEMYKTQMAAFWRAEEIDFSKDHDDFETLNKDEQHFIKMILAFFAASDGIVNFNLRERFLKDVKIMEAQICYSFQMMIENVHSETYSLMLESLVKDPAEKEKLFNAIETVPSVKKMADWAFKWIDSRDRFAYRVVAFAIVEGIFFSGAFAAIFWLKKYRGNGRHFMNGLIKSNEFIARDEGMHTSFACLLYSHLINKLNEDEIHAMISDAVSIAKTFTEDAIQCKLIGMNEKLMNQYIEYVGDRLAIMLGYSKIFNSINPFDFMESIGMLRKTNFFESRPTEYQAAYSQENKASSDITILDDF
jgi:ribonucleoside-diphosphate reductase beta chain